MNSFTENVLRDFEQAIKWELQSILTDDEAEQKLAISNAVSWIGAMNMEYANLFRW